ncbi:GTP cyclohydrolase II [Nocardia sp. NPDC020380]|uniref:GTP cyclohydrolase II n=1 Tax=Nocardia sp. NPDC020380 TaxID=3364309 RepID=UPI00378DD91A
MEDHEPQGRKSEDRKSTSHVICRKGRELPVRQVMELSEKSRDGARAHAGQVVVFGDIADGCLVRIHSRCLYGDVLRSDDCDCGPEIDLAMDRIQSEGSGVLIYLDQEGRGSGLVVKAEGLGLADRTGVDSFASYRALGHPVDSRSYGQAAETLAGLGLTSVRLMTNNPDKLSAVRRAGITVQRVPLLTVPRSERARRYMESKRRVAGHHLPVPDSLGGSWICRFQQLVPAPLRPFWEWFGRVPFERTV